MNLRTSFLIDPSPVKISHSDRVMFIGSCFASSIGAMMDRGKIPVIVNPSGTVFNPVSVGATLDRLISCSPFTRDDLHCHDEIWLSFSHYTDFSSDSPEFTLEKINSRLKESSCFLEKSGFLFITFGTSRVYRFLKTGKIVSNCHKIPSEQFSNELLSVSTIVSLWMTLLDSLSSQYPHLKIIFTISPVRHLKDGAHGNQVSKSTLILAVEELLNHQSHPYYFPAYELMMDDLRDYRFYDEDMLHPSSSAVEYIWQKFSDCWFNQATRKTWEEASRITAGMSHRFISNSLKSRVRFAENMLVQISRLENRVHGIDFSVEKDYFQRIIESLSLSDTA